MIDKNDKMFISIGISLCEDNFQILHKVPKVLLLTFILRKLKYRQELVLLLV